MAPIIFFVLALAASAAARPSNMSFEQDEADGKAYLNSPLFLDDMRFVEGQLEQAKTTGIPNEQLRWTRKMVPYVMDPSVGAYIFLIQQAMEEYHGKTCVRFVPRTIQKNYIRIFAGEGCYSHVGMIGGEQPMSLAVPGCMIKGTIVHELGHAIGFFHEQNRSDRDEYITVNWDNIQQGQEFNFDVLKPNENILGKAYDYDSIMHYGNHAFSKDGKSATMVAKSGVRLVETYYKFGLTAEDVAGINSMYAFSVWRGDGRILWFYDLTKSFDFFMPLQLIRAMYKFIDKRGRLWSRKPNPGFLVADVDYGSVKVKF